MDDFIADLISVAPATGQGYYAFVGTDGEADGFVQIIPWVNRRVTIYRLWTRRPGQGNGAKMLRALCDVADRHGVELELKPLPFGRKPYPMSRDQLLSWYERHGFRGNRRKMIRLPQSAQKVG
jgi:hypothetical protein